MLTLRATVITLAFLAGVIEPQSVFDNLPVNQLPVDTVVPALQQPRSVPVPKPSSPTGQHPKGQHPAGSARGKCPAMASYLLSAEKLQEYLNGTLPAKIEELVRCSDMKLAGLVGSLLTTVTGGDLLSVLPLDAITNILPLGILDNVLGKGDTAKPKGNADAPEAPALPPVDKEAVANPVSSIIPGTAAAEPVSQLTRQVSSNVNDITGPVQGLLSNGVPGVTSKLNDITGSFGGLLSNGVPGLTSKLNDITGPVQGLLSNGVPGVTSKLSSITGSVGGLLSNGAPGVTSKLSSITGSVGGLLKSVGGKNLGNVVSQVKGLSKGPSDLLGNLLSSDSSKAGDGEALGGKGGLDVSGLLLQLKLGEVNVVKTKYSMGNDGVEVQSTVTADVQSDGVAGAAITALGFQVELCVSMIIRSTHDPTNNTVQLEVEQKTMEVTKVAITLVETVTNALPLPLPLPLPVDSVLLMALSVDLTQNAKESSCGIQFPDFDSGKNETGVMCIYSIDSTRISAKGLHIYFCAKCSGINNSSWVSGSKLADHPKNDSVSVIVSHKAVREHVSRCVALVKIKEGNIEASVRKFSYKYPSANVVEVEFTFQLKMNGMDSGIVVLVLRFSHKCRIENGKLVVDIKLQSTSLKSSTVPETMGEMTEAMKPVVDKTVNFVTECLGKWNFPTGPSSHPVSSAKITVLKTDDLHVGK